MTPSLITRMRQIPRAGVEPQRLLQTTFRPITSDCQLSLPKIPFPSEPRQILMPRRKQDTLGYGQAGCRSCQEDLAHPEELASCVAPEGEA